MQALLDSTCEVLSQTHEIIEALAPADYSRAAPGSLSGVGAHVRHILDHFTALQVGLADGRVDYNCRSRGSTMEQDPRVAQATIAELKTWLANTELADCPLLIETEISVSQACNITLPSSLARELAYIISHTVHHLAHSRLIAAQLGVEINPEIGLAPATASFLRRAAT